MVVEKRIEIIIVLPAQKGEQSENRTACDIAPNSSNATQAWLDPPEIGPVRTKFTQTLIDAVELKLADLSNVWSKSL